MDAAAWEAIVPSMGYMALAKNLRNFDEAGLPAATCKAIAERLADPDEVARSRQLPLRFPSAYKAVSNDRWRVRLGAAVEHSLAGVPRFPGRTLVLVDCSGSMWSPLSRRGTLQRYQAAALFGSALALRAEQADLVAFGTGWQRIWIPKGGSLLPMVSRFPSMGGTNTFQALAASFEGHDRVVILTDEQAFPARGSDPAAAIKVPIYTFNLAGYHAGHLPSGQRNRYTFGGLTGAGFTAMAALDQRHSAGWPF